MQNISLTSSAPGRQAASTSSIHQYKRSLPLTRLLSALALFHISIYDLQRADTPWLQTLAPQPKQEKKPALSHLLPRNRDYFFFFKGGMCWVFFFPEALMATLGRWPLAGDGEVLGDLAGKPGQGERGAGSGGGGGGCQPVSKPTAGGTAGGEAERGRRGGRAAPGAGGGSGPLRPPRSPPASPELAGDGRVRGFRARLAGCTALLPYIMGAHSRVPLPRTA